MIFIAILLIAGLATKQPRRYWLHAGAAVAAQFVLGLLLAGYGTLENPAGDGIITRWVRAATNDGPLMGFWALIVIALTWASRFTPISCSPGLALKTSSELVVCTRGSL